MDKVTMSAHHPREENDERSLGLLHPNAPLTIVLRATNSEPLHCARSTLTFFKGIHLRSVLKRNSENDMIADFRLWSHTPAQVSAALLHFLPTHKNLTKLGITSIDKAFSIMKKYDELRSRPNQNPEDTNTLTEYFHLFDKLYFCGSISRPVYVEVAPRGYEGLLVDDYGDFCSNRGTSQWKPRADFHGRIRIADISQSNRFADPEKRLHHYLGTLLHEMIHAAFELYVCYHHRGCKERERRYLGDDGHGWLYKELAVLLECATEELPKGGLSIV